MTLDTQMTPALMQELLMALRANDADGLAAGREPLVLSGLKAAKLQMPTAADICSSRNAPLVEVITSHAATLYLPTLTNTVLPTRTDASQSPLPISSITHKCVAYD